MNLKKLLTLVTILALLTTACGGEDGDTASDDGAEDSGGSATVAVETLDNEFQPPELEVPAGETEITLDNTGAARHSFTSEELGVDEDVEPGQQTTFTVDAQPGSYQFVCKYHESLGMVGTMTVDE